MVYTPFRTNRFYFRFCIILILFSFIIFLYRYDDFYYSIIIANLLNPNCDSDSNSYILLYSISNIHDWNTIGSRNISLSISSNTLGSTYLGLGNQMFILASLYGIGRDLGASSIVECKKAPKLKFIKEFRIGESKKVPKFNSSSLLIKRIDFTFGKCCVYFDFIKDLKSSELDGIDLLIVNGYLQSWKYFHHYRSEIVGDLFRFRSSIEKQAEMDFRRFVKIQNPTNIHLACIHARRGDFHGTKEKNEGYIGANSESILSTIQFFNRTLSNRDFLVLLFSDDSKWCMQKFGHISHLVIAIGDQTGPVAMQMMRKYCNSIFITASQSSFGWWAAYLNNRKTKIYYNAIPAIIGSRIDYEMEYKDHFLPEWISVHL